ncbi:MFS monocarboxylate transporter-like protein [Penicillium lividum]|nr:MFS monocarboxylate transporter-like protein [Penicillium lividum]
MASGNESVTVFREHKIQLAPSDTKQEAPEKISENSIIAWCQVLVSHLLVVNGFGYFSSFGLFESHWTAYLGKSSSEISWVGSLSLFFIFFLGALSGPMMDRGHLRLLLFVGCGIQLLGVFTTSAVSQYWQLVLSQGIVQGIGNGLLFTPCIALVSTYFSKRRAFTLSLAACGAPIGGVIFPLIIQQLSPRIGYPWAIRVMGFVMMANTAFILLLARPPHFKRTQGPLLDPKAFKEPTYLLFAIGIFFTLWGVYIAYFYTATYGKQVIHLSDTDSLTQLMVLNAVGIPGRMVPGLLADAYFGAFNMLLPFVFSASIMLFGWIGAKDSGSFYGFIIIYGICSNAVQTLFPSTLSQLTTDLSKMASRVGMVFTVASIACLTGPPIAGALIGLADGSYLYAQLFGGTSVMLGFILLSAARWTQITRKD